MENNLIIRVHGRNVDDFIMMLVCGVYIYDGFIDTFIRIFAP